MARTGITKDQVAAAADAIKARGQTPTIAAIRQEIGSGSFTTIAQYLAAWKNEAQEAAEQEQPLPESVENAALQAIATIWRVAMNVAGEDTKRLKIQHDEELAEMRQQLDEALKEVAELEAMNLRIDAKVHQAEDKLREAEKESAKQAQEHMRLLGEVDALHRAIALLKPQAGQAADTKKAAPKAQANERGSKTA